jgi:hypothetical protein
VERAKPTGIFQLGRLQVESIGGSGRRLASGGSRERHKPDGVRIVQSFDHAVHEPQQLGCLSCSGSADKLGNLRHRYFGYRCYSVNEIRNMLPLRAFIFQKQKVVTRKILK